MASIETGTTSIVTPVPLLAIPDEETARRLVGQWLRREIGSSALYPVKAVFIEESFAWLVPVWYSTPSEPMLALVADVYLHAATGPVVGRQSRAELLERVKQILGEKE
jgi:hypothetical protein